MQATPVPNGGFLLRVCLIPITIAGARLLCAAWPREHPAREGEASEHQTCSEKLKKASNDIIVLECIKTDEAPAFFGRKLSLEERL